MNQQHTARPAPSTPATSKLLRAIHLLLSLTLLLVALMVGVSIALDLPSMGLLITLADCLGLWFLMSALVFRVPALALAFSAMGILLMSGLILYQTSEIIHGSETNYIMATIDLYLDIVILFSCLYLILGRFAGQER